MDTWLVSCRSSRSLSVFSSEVLIYRPPLENVCELGEKCPRKNDPIHGELYVHSKPRIPKSFRTTIVNREKKIRIPGVDQAYVVEDDMEASEIPSNRVVVVFVHGFNENIFRVTSHLSHLSKKLPKLESVKSWPLPRGKNFTIPTSVVGFTWPSNAMLGAVAGASRRLRKTLSMLLKRRNNIVLIGHSRGCEVVLNALKRSKKQREFVRPIWTTLLVAGAVQQDEMRSDGGSFSPSRLETRRLVVLHSKADAILRKAVRFRRSRLIGLHGMPSDDEEHGHNVQVLDMTNDVGTAHSMHTYLQRDPCFFCLLNELETAGSDLLRVVSSRL